MRQDDSFVHKKCRPCERGANVLSRARAEEYIEKVPGWQISDDGKSIFREYWTKDFMAAVAFLNKVADMAEAENHHPDVHLTGYRKLKIELSTHAIGGLSENDFILASKINETPVDLKV